ncbi:hypothetical protein [Streptomyces sp. AC602_WCS936]|uniref:hypothetical protein n=1 Tax=Streptomyces sp. AC602_WCS936 TaxID=2823685 RepID=UPI001C277491|nr:hypothetical protein [Streptomyces sp. AC602_WCS936]
MRRTARALSTTVLAGAALGVFAAPAPADPGVPPPPIGVGEPVAEVSPADVAPGDTVTVSVTCAPTGGSAPATLAATSPAFESGTVELRKVGDGNEATAGAAYRGTARIATAEDVASGPGASDPEAAGSEEAWTVDGACPEASGEEGDPWSATMTAPQAPRTVPEEPLPVPDAPVAVPEEGGGAVAPPCPGATAGHGGTSSRSTTSCATKPACTEPAAPHDSTSAQRKDCGGTTAEHGVHAGEGGTFTDSVPALAAGGLLIAGAGAAAAHRLLRFRSRGDAGHR